MILQENVEHLLLAVIHGRRSPQNGCGQAGWLREHEAILMTQNVDLYSGLTRVMIAPLEAAMLFFKY